MVENTTAKLHFFCCRRTNLIGSMVNLLFTLALFYGLSSIACRFSRFDNIFTTFAEVNRTYGYKADNG